MTSVQADRDSRRNPLKVILTCSGFLLEEAAPFLVTLPEKGLEGAWPRS